MSETILAALIGAVAVVVAVVIQSPRRRSGRADAVEPSEDPAIDPLPSQPPPPTTPAPVATLQSRSPEPAPSHPGETLSAEEVIAMFEREGGWRGQTAMPGSSYFEAAKGLRYVRCECAASDPSYDSSDFIARGKRGGYYYICLGTQTGRITCGREGYHNSHRKVPECI